MDLCVRLGLDDCAISHGTVFRYVQEDAEQFVPTDVAHSAAPAQRPERLLPRSKDLCNDKVLRAYQQPLVHRPRSHRLPHRHRHRFRSLQPFSVVGRSMLLLMNSGSRQNQIGGVVRA